MPWGCIESPYSVTSCLPGYCYHCELSNFVCQVHTSQVKLQTACSLMVESLVKAVLTS